MKEYSRIGIGGLAKSLFDNELRGQSDLVILSLKVKIQ